VEITQQLAVFLENRPGMLARICDALSKEKINIYAISSSDTVDHIVVRLVVSDPDRALHLFEEHGVLIVKNDVLMIESNNKPGSLASIAHKLAEAKINIEYAYCATPPDAKKGLLILRTSDAKRALKVLNA
jgi:hypothetical protein